MIKIILMLLFTVTLNAGGFTVIPAKEDAFHAQSWESDQAFLAEYDIEDRIFIQKISRESLVPIKVLYRLHFMESKLGKYGDRYEHNGTTSIGFSQLNSSNLKWFSDRFNDGITIDPYDKYENIRIGALYLRDLYQRFDNNWISAGIAYNWGEGNLRSDRVIPQKCWEYGFILVYGADFASDVQIIKGAVEGIL